MADLDPPAAGLAPGDPVALISGNVYADYAVAPADQVLRLPADWAGRPFPGEPLGCLVNIFRRSEIRSGQTVAIIGIGFLGALLTQLAVRAGARVIAISRRPYALDIARRSGAFETIPLQNHGEIIQRVHDLTDGRFCDRVIEVVGQQWPLDLAAELTRERGRLIIAGYHQDGPRRVNLQLWNWRGLDVINAHERDPRVYLDGMTEAGRLVMAGDLDPAPLYTHQIPLERLGEGFDLMLSRPDGLLKILVQP